MTLTVVSGGEVRLLHIYDHYLMYSSSLCLMLKGSHHRCQCFAVTERYVSGKTYIVPSQG